MPKYNGHTTSGLDQAIQDHADRIHPTGSPGGDVESGGITGITPKPKRNYGSAIEPGGITGQPSGNDGLPTIGRINSF